MERRIRSLVRAECGLSGTPYPIVVVPGGRPPELVGESYYWTTPSGRTRVRHPNAYGWPTLYHASTRRIEVGEQWVMNLISENGGKNNVG